MMVFPLGRSVGLSAATASSSVATLPTLALVSGVALAEQIIETITIFGREGFIAPGGLATEARVRAKNVGVRKIDAVVNSRMGPRSHSGSANGSSKIAAPGVGRLGSDLTTRLVPAWRARVGGGRLAR